MPPLHTSFDFVTTHYKHYHILGVLAHEASRQTKGIETYVLDVIDWEKLVEEEIESGSESSDEYMGDNEESGSEYFSSEGDGDESSSYSGTEESADDGFIYEDYKDIDLDDIDASDESDGML